MLPDELRAKPGDNILEKFNALAEYLETQRLRAADESILVSPTPHGAMVTKIDTPPAIPIPLTVRFATPTSFVVGEGYINGLVPRGKDVTTGQLKDCFDPLTGQVQARISMPREPMPVYFFVCMRYTNLLRFLGGQMEVKAFHIDQIRDELGGLEQVFLGRTYPSTSPSKQGDDVEAYIPLAFTRGLRPIQFCRHNLLARMYQPAGFESLRKFVFWAT